MRHFDLNCDMGELDSLVEDGTQAELLKCVTSVNVCCNAHAGSEALIWATLKMSQGVRIGAHPGYPDRLNFGRRVVVMPMEALVVCIVDQLVWIDELAQRCGVGPLTHVKPHGALYNAAVQDREVALAIAEAAFRWNPEVLLVGLAGSLMLDVFREAGLRVWSEGFADRAYESDGSLRSRSLDGALIVDPDEAAEQAWRLLQNGFCDTICVHSDTPGAVAIAKAVALRCGNLQTTGRMGLDR